MESLGAEYECMSLDRQLFVPKVCEQDEESFFLLLDCGWSRLSLQDNSYDTWLCSLTVTSFGHTFGSGERSAAPRVHRAPVSQLLPSQTQPVNDAPVTCKCNCLLNPAMGQLFIKSSHGSNNRCS